MTITRSSFRTRAILLLSIMLACLSAVVRGTAARNQKALLQQALCGITLSTSCYFSTLLPITKDWNWAGVTAAHAATETNALPYGINKGRLLPCKGLSNCISTSSVNSVDKYGRPWAFEKDAVDEFEDLVNAVKGYSYLKIADVDKENFYLRAEAKSAFPPTGVDDVEFLLNPKEKLVTYRSNSRELLKAGADLVGDGGSNRNRLEAVKRRLGVSEMDMNDETAAYMEQVTNKMSFFDRLKAASQPNEINFIDNSVPEE